MKKLISLLFYLPFILKAQSGYNPGFGSSGAPESICNQLNFSNDQEVTQLIKKILLEGAGVVTENYEVKGCTNVKGCFTTVHNNKQYVIYQTNYLDDIKRYAFSYSSMPVNNKEWQKIAVLAHEVGHLQNGHFYEPKPGVSGHDKELQADYFAGRVISILGGTLEQAESIYYTNEVPEEGSYSHPPRAARLAAVREGYASVVKVKEPVKVIEVQPVIKKIETDDEVRQNLQSARKAFAIKDYDKAGLIYSQYIGHQLLTTSDLLNMAVMYENGWGVVKSEDIAYSLYSKLASSGHAEGQYKTGEMAWRKKDFVNSSYWYRLAAEQGHSAAQYEYAYNLYIGRGVVKNIPLAIYWYTKSAEKGEAKAQNKLGHIYKIGKDVEENLYEAFKWFKLAADQGYAAAQSNLAKLYEKGRGCTQSLSMAIEYYRMAARQGDEEAKQELSRLGYGW